MLPDQCVSDLTFGSQVRHRTQWRPPVGCTQGGLLTGTTTGPCSPEATRRGLALCASAPLCCRPSSRDQVSGGEQVRLCAGPLRGRLGRQPPCVSLGPQRPAWFSEPDVVGAPLPSSGARGWDTSLFGGNPTKEVFLPVFKHCLWVWGSLPLRPASLCPFVVTGGLFSQSSGDS